MADVILKDRNGEDVTYEGVSKIALPMAGGSICTFSREQWTAETLRYDGGTFTPSDHVMTISHHLGTVPDFIFVGRMDADDNVARNQGHIMWAQGWSQRMMDLEHRLYNQVCIDEPDSDSNVNYGHYWLPYTDAPAINGTDNTYGKIHNATALTFTIGQAAYNANGVMHEKGCLSKKSKYYWFAVSGLGIRMNPSGEVE